MDTAVKIADGATYTLAGIYAVLAVVYALAHNSKALYWIGAAILTFWVASVS